MPPHGSRGSTVSDHCCGNITTPLRGRNIGSRIDLPIPEPSFFTALVMPSYY